MIPLEQKTLLTKKKKTKEELAFRSCWLRFGIAIYCMSKSNSRRGLQKCCPRGLWFLCGQWERAEFPTTYSLLETRFTSPVGLTSVCPSNNNVLLFFFLTFISTGILGGICHGKGLPVLTFILQGKFQQGGVLESSLWLIKHDDFSGIWGRQGDKLTLHPLYFCGTR